MFKDTEPQLVTYRNQFETTIAGLFYCDEKIDKPFVEKHILKMVKEKFPEINLTDFQKSFSSNDREIAPSSISANIFDTLNNSGVENITPFYRWSSEKMDQYVDWTLTHDDVNFNVFAWMCEKGIIEKAPYTDSYIN